MYNGTNARICPRCGKYASRVIDVREKRELIQRQRKCLICGFRWQTVEISIFTYEELVKADEKRAYEQLQEMYEGRFEP